jgi:hypothetical protein
MSFNLREMRQAVTFSIPDSGCEAETTELYYGNETGMFFNLNKMMVLVTRSIPDSGREIQRRWRDPCPFLIGKLFFDLWVEITQKVD